MGSGFGRVAGKRLTDGLIKAVGQALFPHFCLVCGEEGRLLCDNCEVQRYGPTRGVFFSLKVKGVEGPVRCFSAGRYADPVLRQLLHLYKYGRVDEAGEILSDFLASKVGRHISALLDGDDDPVVLPVPMNRINMALRGFNQAEILAQSICRELELYALETGALSRCFSWKPQARLSGADKRSKNVAGVFRSDGSVQGVHVLLVDDVFTTGATISECARVLLGAGVEKLTVVTALKG